MVMVYSENANFATSKKFLFFWRRQGKGGRSC